MNKTDETKSGTPGSGAGVAAPSESELNDGWERPVAVEKDRNVRAWLIFLGLLCFLVARARPASATPEVLKTATR